MATYTEIFTLANDGIMQQRIQTAVVKTATLILGEGMGAMTQSQTNKRQVMAKTILNGDINIQTWALAVCNNAAVATAGINATDVELDNAISSLWDDMSGVTTLDTV